MPQVAESTSLIPFVFGHLRRAIARTPWIAAAVLVQIAGSPTSAEGADRVLALGGAVTEIVYALGQGDRLVARDSTSSYPPEAEELPDVGYVRALSPEGLLSVDPDLILAIEGSGPPETMEVLREAEVPLVSVPEGYDADAVLQKISVVAEALNVPEEGAQLAAKVEAALAAAVAAGQSETPPRILFILSMQGGRVMAAGSGTAAQGIIGLAGGINALDGFEGYKQVSDEAVLIANPDVILMMDLSGNHAADDAAVRAHPVLGRTRAAERGAIVRLPGLLLLGFGPRTPQAVEALSRAFQRAQG